METKEIQNAFRDGEQTVTMADTPFDTVLASKEYVNQQIGAAIGQALSTQY